ncbi:hypothetical protein DAPPUDRAFT_249309 [Daphnia pulex]|uniref:Uncharacterized protein n=1 Tax=Daphnia pulex TaxID=6669 RepID=E9GWE1_DAPPU|nr:hypothetical protein DAPPUDRAFT_249309 [Daphnia pulex]|eukprot:EFX76204.1 hypothetical protein DAPPUDRAFT_249309 [Daphnia pulex]
MAVMWIDDDRERLKLLVEPVLLVSLLAGGTGLNLIGANHLFYRTSIGIPKLKRKLATGYMAWGRKKKLVLLNLFEILDDYSAYCTSGPYTLQDIVFSVSDYFLRIFHVSVLSLSMYCPCPAWAEGFY